MHSYWRPPCSWIAPFCNPRIMPLIRLLWHTWNPYHSFQETRSADFDWVKQQIKQIGLQKLQVNTWQWWSGTRRRVSRIFLESSGRQSSVLCTWTLSWYMNLLFVWFLAPFWISWVIRPSLLIRQQLAAHPYFRQVSCVESPQRRATQASTLPFPFHHCPKLTLTITLILPFSESSISKMIDPNQLHCLL